MLAAILLLAAAAPPLGMATAMDVAEIDRRPLVVYVHQPARPVASCIVCRWDRLPTGEPGASVAVYHWRGCELVRTAAIAGYPSPTTLHTFAYPELR